MIQQTDKMVSDTNSYHPDVWDNAFYETDCAGSDLSGLGAGNASKFMIYSIYLLFVLITGYIYGRHKGLSQYNKSSKMEGFGFLKFSCSNLTNLKYIKTKMFDLFSKIWFLLSTFIFPWYFSVIWLFYVIYFNDINYVNTYNPWIIPFIIIYTLYSIMVILSYSFYCDFKRDKCALLMIKSSILFAGCYGMFMFYVLIKNRQKLDDWKVDGFSGSTLKHCFDFDQHKNPTLFLVLFMIYCLVTHHIFVILRAITAKLCYNHYISKKSKQYHANRKLSKRSKSRKNGQSSYERRCVIDPRGGIRAPAYCSGDHGLDVFDIDDFDDDEPNETETESDEYTNDDDNGINNEYVRKSSESKSRQSGIYNGYRINLTPEPPKQEKKSSVPPEFNLVSSVDPSILRMQSADCPTPQPSPSPVAPAAFYV